MARRTRLDKEKADLLQRCHTLEAIAADLHWMAYRYVNGRSSYATSLFNAHTRILLHFGLALLPDPETYEVFARDGMGDAFAGLSQTDKDLEQELLRRHEVDVAQRRSLDMPLATKES